MGRRNDSEKELKSDLENNSYNSASNDDNDFDYSLCNTFDRLKICDEIFCCYPSSIYQVHIATLTLLYSVM